MRVVVVLLFCIGINFAFKTVAIANSAPVTKSQAEKAPPNNNDWVYIGTKGGIETYVKSVEGSNLLAFRGVAYLDMHISQAIGPYINLTMARDWVSMLKQIRQYSMSDTTESMGKGCVPNENEMEDIVHQVGKFVFVNDSETQTNFR